jgi:hypothetical protein
MTGAQIVLNVKRAQKSFWTQPMELLGDVGQLEARFGPLGDGVDLCVRKVHGLPRMYHGHENLGGRTRWTSR